MLNHLNTPVPQDSPAENKEKILLELERENQELVDKIQAIEGNINAFVKEMGGLLEELTDEEGLQLKQGIVGIRLGV